MYILQQEYLQVIVLYSSTWQERGYNYNQDFVVCLGGRVFFIFDTLVNTLWKKAHPENIQWAQSLTEVHLGYKAKKTFKELYRFVILTISGGWAVGTDIWHTPNKRNGEGLKSPGNLPEDSKKKFMFQLCRGQQIQVSHQFPYFGNGAF